MSSNSKRRKKNRKTDRRKRLHADERIAKVALKKFLAVQESAVLMVRDFASWRPGELIGKENDVEIRMTGGSVSFCYDEKDRWISKQVVDAISNANIFIMSPDQYVAYHHEADFYTTEEISGYDWLNGGNEEKWNLISLDEAQDHMEKVISAGRLTPLPDPERWPFSSMWISFGAGIPMSKLMLAARLQSQTIVGMGMKNAILLGQLWTLTDNGPLIIEAIEFMSDNDYTGSVAGICWGSVFSPLEPDPGWRHPYDLNPWICNAIHAHLISFKTFVIERNWTPEQRRNIRKGDDVPNVIEQIPIPKPYYLIKLKNSVIHEGFRSALPPRRKFEYQHRFHVRGHYRVRVKRGLLPMSIETREILVARKYTIYAINPMSERHTRMLAERGVSPKRPHEWVAILESWVRDHKKGPDDGPFVPSVRVA